MAVLKFDITAARREGYSDEEIASYLAGRAGFDLDGALKEGYGYDEILRHLTTDRRSFMEKAGEAAGRVRDAITPERDPQTETTPAARTAADPVRDQGDLSGAGMEAWTGGGRAAAPAAAPMPGGSLDAEIGGPNTDAPDSLPFRPDLAAESLRDAASNAGTTFMREAAKLPGAAVNLANRYDMIDPFRAGEQIAKRGMGIAGLRERTAVDDVIQWFEEKGKWWEERTGKDFLAAEKKQWVTDDWKLGDAWEDPKAYMMGVTASMPATLITMLPSAALARATYGAELARLAPTMGEAAASQVAAAKAAGVAALAGRLSEGTLEGSANDIRAREEVLKMGRAELEKSDAYRALIGAGMSPELARDALANDVGARTLVLSGIATGIFSGAGDRVLAEGITRGLSGNVVKRALRGALAEGLLEEAPQGFVGQIMQNVAMLEAKPDTKLLAGAANAAAGGAVAGGIMGAGFGAASREAPTASQVDLTSGTAREKIDRILAAPISSPDGTPPSTPPAVTPGTPPPSARPGIIDSMMAPEDVGLATTPEVPDARPVESAAPAAGSAESGLGPAAGADGRVAPAAGPVPDAAAPEGMGRPAEPGVLPAGPGQPAAGANAAPQGIEDFHTRRGEFKTFKSEKQALAYRDQRTNKVPGNYTPRQLEDGTWALSRPIRERSEAQKANDAKLRRLREQVDTRKDSLATVIGKLGGIRAEDLERDGADPADLKLLRSGVVGKPTVRRKGGLSLDALAELLAGHGFDVLDEEGRPDASKLRDLIDEEIAGTPIYTPEGYEHWGQRQEEEKARRLEAERTDTPEEELDAAGYNDLSDDARDAVGDAIESGADEALDDLDDSLLEGDGRIITDEEADAIFGAAPPESGGDSQASAAGGEGEVPADGEAPAGGEESPPAAAAVAPETPADAGVSASGGDETPPHRMGLADFTKRQEKTFGPASDAAARKEIRLQHLDFIESALERGEKVPAEALADHDKISAKNYPLAAAAKKGEAAAPTGKAVDEFRLPELGGFKLGERVRVGKREGTITGWARIRDKKGNITKDRALVSFKEGSKDHPNGYEQFNDLDKLKKIEQPADPAAPEPPVDGAGYVFDGKFSGASEAGVLSPEKVAAMDQALRDHPEAYEARPNGDTEMRLHLLVGGTEEVGTVIAFPNSERPAYLIGVTDDINWPAKDKKKINKAVDAWLRQFGKGYRAEAAQKARDRAIEDRKNRTLDIQDENKREWLEEILPEVEANLDSLPETIRELVARAVAQRREQAKEPRGTYTSALGGRLVMGVSSDDETLTREEFDRAVKEVEAAGAKRDQYGWELSTPAGDIHLYDKDALSYRPEEFGVWVETPAEVRRLAGIREDRESARPGQPAAKPDATPAPQLELTGQTEAEAQAAAAKAERDRAEKAKRDAAPAPTDFTLTGSNRPVDEARARGQQELVPAEAPAQPAAAPGDYTRFAGKTVTVKIQVEGAPDAELTMKADEALTDIDKRIAATEELLACLK